VLLQDYAGRGASTHPSDTAVVMGDERVSYAELDGASSRLARLLVDRGCEPDDRVCLFASKSPAAVVAMHAVLKAGAAYVPVDVASPAPRVAKVVAAADPRLVLADAGAAGLLDELVPLSGIGEEVPVGSLGPEPVAGERFRSAFAERDWMELPAEAPARPREPGDMAHILFTSGSTGVPKGVVITHAMVTAFLDWAVPYFGTRASDRISGHPPLHFDLSTFDVYGTFAAGAELHLIPAELGVDPRGLAALIRDSELTQWFSVPSALTYLVKFRAIAPGDFPRLERLLWCGEVLPTSVLVKLMDLLPHVRFTNLYGPTEATIASSYYTVPERPADEISPVPIGEPCRGEELIVLDEGLRPVPRGHTGELFIAGAGLSPGYWRDEHKTRDAFLPDPRAPGSGARVYRTGDLARERGDGLLEFLGRTDSQIKSRGYRIELGEIEAALGAVEGLREWAVVGVETGGFEGTTICCAYAPTDGGRLAPTAVRQALARALPGYMLPARWLVLDALPKNVNGKIDKRALRERFAETKG
jgi:amino acid adenylation domain-containing protein